MARKDVPDWIVCYAFARREMVYRTLGLIHDAKAIISIWTGECEKVCYRAMERAYDHDLVIVGGSLNSAWLSAEGWALLDKHKADAEARGLAPLIR